MAYCLSFDGGGTKLNGMLFDEHMNLISTSRSGGISTTQGTLENCRGNIQEGLDQLFSAFTPDSISVLYTTGVGVFAELEAAVRARVPVNRHVHMDEAVGGLLAGALKRYGLLALSGTGSDVFYLTPDGQRDTVGGWGPIVGDDGSGAWIGQQAIRAVVRLINGWGEETLLYDLVREAWSLKKDWDIVPVVHSSAAPLRTVGSLTPVVGRAAAAGDRVALSILREAGHLMAVQTATLIRRHHLCGSELDVTLCGGAWKAHPAMFDAFLSELQAEFPALTAQRPLFEHLICGPALSLLDAGLSRDEAEALLREKFPMYIVPTL